MITLIVSPRLRADAAPDVTPFAASMLGHWSLDGTVGTQAADTTGARPAQLRGEARWSKGRYGMAIDLDGRTGYVQLGDLGSTAEATIAFWMKPQDVGKADYQGLVTTPSWGKGMLHLPIREGRIDAFLHLGGRNRARVWSGTLPNGRWTHVGITISAITSRMVLYVDGTRVAEDRAPGLGVFSMPDMTAGYEGERRYFEGGLDEIVILSRALSPEGVAYLGGQDAQPAAEDRQPGFPAEAEERLWCRREGGTVKGSLVGLRGKEAILLVGEREVPVALSEMTARDARYARFLAGMTRPPDQADSARSRDWRNINTGNPIPDEGYCDQPYVVVNGDGSWTCLLTTGKGHEGQGGQHVVATITRDKGKTWTPLIDIEPADGPEASWVVPLVTPAGRIYGFYTYNGDQVNTLPGSDKRVRSDTHGWYCYKYSDDGGQTWSERHRIPMRVTACDRGSQFKGDVQMFWGIDKPSIVDGNVYFAFTKLGKYFLGEGEGWLYHSDNILTERGPEAINWELRPEGEHGVRAREFGSVQTEFNLVPLGEDRLYMIYRTTQGYPCQTYSRDGGKTWEKPVPMVYAPGGRAFKTPRACPKLWRCVNGKYLFWFHHHGGRDFRGRNPAWISGGVLKDGYLHWSQPEILLYHSDPKERMSYPDLIEQDGRYWITETQKSVARVHEVPADLLEGMWRQLDGEPTVAEGAVLSLSGDEIASDKTVPLPELPDLGLGGGFGLGVWLEVDDLVPGQTILDSRDGTGCGFALSTGKEGNLVLSMGDGLHSAEWPSDPGTLTVGKQHHVVFIVDGGPRIISVVCDGVLRDGGPDRQYGWGRFDPQFGSPSGGSLRIAPGLKGAVKQVRLYSRYLRTSQAVGNFRSGIAEDVPGNWRRSDPLSAIYLPTASSENDRCNQQVVGIVTKADSYLVTWTMASEESRPDQRVAISRSTDNGRNWSAAQIIAGDSPTHPGAASYSWLFQVPKTGRIYCFYLKNDPSVITVRRDITGWLKWQYSDDDGITWHRVNTRFDMGRGEWTSADPSVPTSFIGIYAPHTTSWGDVLFSFARYGLKEKGGRGYGNWMTEAYFMRLDNILTEPDPEKLTFSILPDSPCGLRIRRSNGLFWGNEPSWIELNDGRLMTAIRTRNDAVYYALSGDRGNTWTKPAPLRYSDDGDIVRNPNAPCPLIKTSDGRILLMFYNSKQTKTFGPRNPVWISHGFEDQDAEQPVRFAKPVKFMEVDGKPPLGSTYVQIASYSTFAEHDGRLLLFYNDCKHWVLFKRVDTRSVISEP